MATENTEAAGQNKSGAFTSAAIARRRMLLKGVGKGTAVLAASVPIQTLANQSLLTFDGKHQASISGMFSGVHSATPTTTPLAGGFSPGWWGQSNSDTPLVPSRTWPALPGGWTYNTKCRSVFTQTTLPGDPTLFQVMQLPIYANTDERHWICAWLNALSHSFNFPYSGQQVVDFYNQGRGSAAYTNALTFFKTYMETHV